MTDQQQFLFCPIPPVMYFSWSGVMLDLMENMLTLDPEERSTVFECQQHDAFVTDRLLWQQRRHRSLRGGGGGGSSGGGRGSAKSSRARSSLGVAAKAEAGDTEAEVEKPPSRLGAVSVLQEERRGVNETGFMDGFMEEKKNRFLMDRLAEKNSFTTTTTTTTTTAHALPARNDGRPPREGDKENGERAPSRAHESGGGGGVRGWLESHAGNERRSLPPVDAAWTKEELRKQSAGSTRHGHRGSQDYDSSIPIAAASKNLFRYAAPGKADGGRGDAGTSSSQNAAEMKSTFTTKFSLDGATTPRGKEKKMKIPALQSLK